MPVQPLGYLQLEQTPELHEWCALHSVGSSSILNEQKEKQEFSYHKCFDKFLSMQALFDIFWRHIDIQIQWIKNSLKIKRVDKKALCRNSWPWTTSRRKSHSFWSSQVNIPSSMAYLARGKVVLCERSPLFTPGKASFASSSWVMASRRPLGAISVSFLLSTKSNRPSKDWFWVIWNCLSKILCEIS